MLKNKFFIGNLTRRRLLKWAGVLTGSSLIPLAFKNKWSKIFLANESFAKDVGNSIPAIEPFVDPLPFPPPPMESPFDPDMLRQVVTDLLAGRSERA